MKIGTRIMRSIVSKFGMVQISDFFYIHDILLMLFENAINL